ncbi:hypothetical protein [Enterococcus hirae]|uniref:hypothetical protein n=1 Tax=Enterococcus hirae TaxID=1354 RepID=UPI003AAF3902
MKINKKIVLLTLLVVIASLYSFLFFKNAQKISTTGNLSFHFSRIKGLTSVLLGPVNFSTFNNYGGGVNFFYPYLTLFPAVIFYRVTNNLILSYILYVWVLNVCTIVVIYHYGKKFFKSIDAAFMFSCLYSFYGYRLIDIYQRSAISEAIALTIIPVVLYYTYCLIFEKKNCVICLAISMSLLIYTHVISTFLSVFVIGSIFIGTIISNIKDKKAIFYLIISMLKAISWTILLTAYVWYPMLQQVLYQKINRPFTTNLQKRALDLSESLIGSINNDLTTFTMGSIGMISLILPIFFFKKFGMKEKFIYFFTIITWFLSTNLFPWEVLQKTPFLLIQFPWRILGLQVLFGSLILTLVFSKWRMDRTNSIYSIVGILILLFVVTMATEINYSQKIESYKGNLIMTKKDVTRYTTSCTVGLYDYAPLNALKYKQHLKKHEVKIGNKWEKSTYKVYNSKIVYVVEGAEDLKVTLPVFNYWGTVVKINGKKTNLENDNGLVSIKSNRGLNIVEVSSTYPITMILSLFISLGTLLFLFVRYLFYKVKLLHKEDY